MKRNVGNADKWVRIILGIILLWWGFTGLQGLGQWIVIIIGLILIITGIVHSCPIYSMLGMSTCKIETVPSPPTVERPTPTPPEPEVEPPPPVEPESAQTEERTEPEEEEKKTEF